MSIPPMRYLVCEFNKVSGNCKGILARFRIRANAEEFYNELMSEYIDEDRPLVNIVDIQECK